MDGTRFDRWGKDVNGLITGPRKMTFERYSGGQHEALIQLHRSALVGISHGFSQEEEEADLQAIEAVYLRGGGEFFIGLLEGRLVAMGGFRMTGQGIAELKRMRIATDLQGRGIGGALLALLEKTAGERGIGKLTLESAASRPNTLSFYKKHGYSQVGESHYGTQATVCFEKVLRDKDSAMNLPVS
jgi:GNAT superfamily N-acetyltransferase